LGYIRWGLGNLALAWLAGWRGSWGDNLGFSVLVLFFFFALAFGWGRDQIDWLHCSSMAVVLCNTESCVLWDGMRKGATGRLLLLLLLLLLLPYFIYTITDLLIYYLLPPCLPTYSVHFSSSLIHGYGGIVRAKTWSLVLAY
jgi:hypothetical protein